MRNIRTTSVAVIAAALLLATAIMPSFALGEVAPPGDCVSCGDPFVTDLIAAGGSDEGAMDVGDIIVRNCESMICVEYVLSDEALAEGWLLTETHVEVAASLAGIPQTKKANPIPGQFEDGQYHGTGVTAYTYCASLAGMGLESGDDVYIAAHAVVTRRTPGCWNTVWQIGDVEDVDPATGQLYNYADEFNWGYPAGPTTAGPTLAASSPAFADPFIVGSSETTEFPYNSNFSRGYATDFDIQWNGALPWGGRLTFSWSPGISALERKEIVVVGDGMAPSLFTATGSTQSGQGWFMDKYPLIENSMAVGSLPYGTHVVNMRQLAGDGTFWDWVRLEQPCLESESAWGYGPGFSGKNWATYTVYELQPCPVLVDTVLVPATGGVVNSAYSLDPTKDYVIEASGTYRYANWVDSGIADAKYSLRPAGQSYSYHAEPVPTWVSGDDLPAPWTNYLEVHIGGSAVDWGAFNSEHVYSADVTGASGMLAFQILDNAYSDNSGFITVRIYEMR